ncbi:VMAP-C domain-containing protein [Streptomyces rubiginosohelvolus]|uniref:VMAP-C domain-containing protein n=1 Tax=Streptomyces rubiginosohelvolus TaxID=67362 RepID=UPI0036D01894
MNAVPHGRPGPDLVQILVDALTLLDCVKDRSQRFEFVDVVAYRLDIELTYPDTTPRIDMTHVVRKVIHRPGGPEALIYAVRAVSGKDDADRIAAEAGIRTDGERPGAWPAPVFADDVARQARRLLGETADIDAGRLRALLAEELPGELPDHGTPAELFDHALDMTACADGLPAAVVLVEVAAATSAKRGAPLRVWSDRWAAGDPTAPAGDARGPVPGAVEALAGCRERLKHPAAPDPTVPRCLVVMVDPARDGSPDVFVRHWINKVPGYWRPEPGSVETATLETLATAVERAVDRGESLWAERTAAGAGPVHVEFLLPFDLLNHDMARLELGTRTPRSWPIGMRYRVHLRSLDRMRGDAGQLRRWQARWDRLRTAPAPAAHRWKVADRSGFERWRAQLAGDESLTAVILDEPAVQGRGLEALQTAVVEGVGLAAWDRRLKSTSQSSELLTLLLGHSYAQLPETVNRLRVGAEIEEDGPLWLGRHIAFLWDDPHRLVDREELLSA